MNARGVEFLENWIQKNVTALDPSDDPMRASNLATRCIAEAAAHGLTLEEIQPDSGSVESHIAEAMRRLAGESPPSQFAKYQKSATNATITPPNPKSKT